MSSSTTNAPSTVPILRRLAPATLRGQALTILVLAGLVSALGTYLLITPWYARAFKDEARKRSEALAQVMERHQDVRAALAGKSWQAAAELAAQVMHEPQLRYLVLVDADGAVVGGVSTDNRDLATIAAEHEAGGADDPDLVRLTRPVTMEAPAEARRILGSVHLALSGAPARLRLANQGAAALLLTAVVMGVAFLVFFQRLARRLDRLGAYAADVAAGKLATSPDDGGADEIAALARSLDAMGGRSGAMVLRLQTAAQALARSSMEILTSSTHQGESATRQAASVSETGATVAELRETFKQAAERAQAVIDLAKRSEESTSTGRRAVEESVVAMTSIRDQVLAISKTMMGLVERTNQIGTIIDAVNDLAEQSNVLALNAAIEAAKAGEQGRGFAVVAREVRNLAERSKDSTAQVRAILQDIEKASRDALETIAEGTRKTETGMELASRAGESIGSLDLAIGESSTAAKQIAASTRQQAVGVEQIWQAMRDIDRAVNESASGIRQLEIASKQMKELSDQMTQLVAQYQVGGGE